MEGVTTQAPYRVPRQRCKLCLWSIADATANVLHSADMDLVPKEPNFDDRILKYQDDMGELLSEQARAAQKVNRIPKQNKKQRFIEGLGDAFELVGGVPRLAMWADHNLTEFYKICGKSVPGMIQQMQLNVTGDVKIVTALPPPQNSEEVIDATFEDVQSE